MEIKLNIDGGDFSKEVNDLIASLSVEEKKAMTQEMVENVLKDSESRFSAMGAKERALAEMNKLHPTSCKDNDGNLIPRFKLDSDGNLKDGNWCTDYKFRDQFDELVKKYSDVRSFFLDEVLNQMLKHAVGIVAEKVRNSDIINKEINRAVKEIEGKIPDMVQKTMQTMFVEMMFNTVNNAKTALQNSYDNSNYLSNDVNQIRDTLNRNNIY